MMVLTRILSGLVLVWLLASVALAAQPPGEFDFLPRYPNSELERAVRLQVPEYRLILGQLRIVGNEVRSEERWLSGDLTRLTYQLPGGHSSQTAMQHYRTQLKTLGADILFSCASRDCGRSSEWASEIFKIANLYGVDREQNYLVARLTQGAQSYFIAVYTIMRGNQKVFAHLDVLATESSGEVSASPKESPRPVIPLRNGEFGATLPEALSAFVAAAKEAPDKQIWIVVHTSGQGYKSATDKGRTIAERVKLWLATRGVSADRIQALPVGPLAPPHSVTVSAERVELFLLDP